MFEEEIRKEKEEMTKEEIFIKTLNDRCVYEHSKEMDYNVHLAIMDAMDEYIQHERNVNRQLSNEIESLKKQLNEHKIQLHKP